MLFLAFGGFVLLVAVLAWVSHRRGQRLNGCCAPVDPRDDLRMRAAFDDDDSSDPGRSMP